MISTRFVRVIWNSHIHRLISVEYFLHDNIYMAFNAFSGTLDFIEMPRSLTHMSFSWNDFQLALHFEHLPCGIHELFLHHNVNLRGTYNTNTLPRGVVVGTRSLCIRDTKIKSDTERRGGCFIM